MTRAWNPSWLAYARATGAADPIEAQNRDDREKGSALLPFKAWLAAKRLEHSAVSSDPDAFDAWLLGEKCAEASSVREPEARCTAKVFPLTEPRARECGQPAKHLTERGPRCANHNRKKLNEQEARK